MKKYILSLLSLVTLFVCSLSVSAAESASSIIDKCAAKVSNAPSVSFTFTLSYGQQREVCTMQMERNKFRLRTKEMQVWYDGTTQWVYITESRELDITEPTREELLEGNPFAILTDYSKQYTVRRLGGNKLSVELVAKNADLAVRKAVVDIDSKTYLPSRIVVTMTNGRTLTATISEAKIEKKLPASTFIYDKATYPAAEIVDLR